VGCGSKADANLNKHGIDFADVVTLLEDELALTMRDESCEARKKNAGSAWEQTRPDALRWWCTHGARNTRRKDEARYDFSKAKRGAAFKTPPGKTRITIRLDNGAMSWIREQAHASGGGSYQSLINEALVRHVGAAKEPLECTLRRVIREELHTSG